LLNTKIYHLQAPNLEVFKHGTHFFKESVVLSSLLTQRGRRHCPGRKA